MVSWNPHSSLTMNILRANGDIAMRFCIMEDSGYKSYHNEFLWYWFYWSGTGHFLGQLGALVQNTIFRIFVFEFLVLTPVFLIRNGPNFFQKRPDKSIRSYWNREEHPLFLFNLIGIILGARSRGCSTKGKKQVFWPRKSSPYWSFLEFHSFNFDETHTKLFL